MKRWKEGLKRWIHQLEFTTKEKYIMGLVLLGTIIGMIVLLILDNQPLSGSLYRNIYGGGSKEEFLRVVIDSEEYKGEYFDIEISVSEEAYTAEELDQAFLEGIEELDPLILGENESLDKVYYDLELVSEIPETGIKVEWSWMPYEVLNIYGEIQEDYVGDGVVVELTSTLSYEEEEVEYIRFIFVLPKEKTEIENLLEEIVSIVEETDAETRTEDQLTLPEEVSGTVLSWYASPSYRGMGILVFGIGIIVYLIWRKEEDKRKQKKIRKEQLLLDYPQLIHTFSLYIGAGMTVKNAWKRMVQENDETRYVFLEMKQTYMEMLNGFSETEAYESFGRRCNIRCYQRLGLLLSQNVRKGTKGLIAILEREAIEASEERRNRIKQEGEKAGTKLLMPMFLMLVMVLTIVIVPAFFSIQI